MILYTKTKTVGNFQYKTAHDERGQVSSINFSGLNLTSAFLHAQAGYPFQETQIDALSQQHDLVIENNNMQFSKSLLNHLNQNLLLSHGGLQ